MLLDSIKEPPSRRFLFGSHTTRPPRVLRPAARCRLVGCPIRPGCAASSTWGCLVTGAPAPPVHAHFAADLRWRGGTLRNLRRDRRRGYRPLAVAVIAAIAPGSRDWWAWAAEPELDVRTCESEPPPKGSNGCVGGKLKRHGLRNEPRPAVTNGLERDDASPRRRGQLATGTRTTRRASPRG